MSAWRYQTPRGDLTVSFTDIADAPLVVQARERTLAEDRFFITHGDEFSGLVMEEEHLIDRLMGSDNGCHIVARLDEDIVGVATVEGGVLRRTRHVGRLSMLVRREARGAGVGRALLDAQISWATENPVLEKLSLAVFEDNGRARALYESKGFVVEGRREREYREDDGSYRTDLLMCRFVTSR